jgi:hypothetical protein
MANPSTNIESIRAELPQLKNKTVSDFEKVLHERMQFIETKLWDWNLPNDERKLYEEYIWAAIELDSKYTWTNMTKDDLNKLKTKLKSETNDPLKALDEKIQKWVLKNTLDVMTMDKLESSLKNTETLAKLIPTSHTSLGRGIIGSTMLGRLQELGYHIGVNADGTVFVGSTHKDAIDVENKINAQITRIRHVRYHP